MRGIEGGEGEWVLGWRVVAGCVERGEGEWVLGWRVMAGCRKPMAHAIESCVRTSEREYVACVCVHMRVLGEGGLFVTEGARKTQSVETQSDFHIVPKCPHTRACMHSHTHTYTRIHIHT